MQRCRLRAVRLARIRDGRGPVRAQRLAATTTLDSLAVSVTWDAVDDATSYKLQWRRSDAEEFDANDATTVTGTNASITVSGYGEWVVQAQACNDAGCGPFASHEFETVEAPSAPSGLAAATQLDSLDVSLSWDAVDGATSYKLRWRQADAANFEASDAATSSTTSASITVSGYDRWVVQAQACSDAGCGPFASHDFETVEAPSAPSGLAATTTLDSLAVSVTWDAVDDATSYKLQWRRSDAQSFDAGNAATVTGNSASITVSGYGEWVVQAQACNDAGCGPFASHEFETVEAPSAPTGLAATTTLDSLAVSVTWDAVEGATSYKLGWRQADAEKFDASNATTVTGNTASITVSGYGEWVVQAQACSDAGCGRSPRTNSRRSRPRPRPAAWQPPLSSTRWLSPSPGRCR